MTSCVTENDVSLKVSEPTSPSDCPFNNLHDHMKWAIMKQLPFKDYLNLALTCKKWYQAAISAPRSVKPDVFHESLGMNKASLYTFPRSSETCIIDHTRTTFQLINKVKCSVLWIYEEVSGDLMKFIVLNSSHFEFRVMFVIMDDMDKEKYCSVVPLLDLAPEIVWASNTMVKNDLLLPFLEEYVSHRRIHVDMSENMECVNFVMKEMAALKPDIDSQVSSDDCPFDRLHEDVKWEILKQLKFHDYLNFALTCRKWYQTAISAPRSVKPSIGNCELILDSKGLTYDEHYYGLERCLDHRCVKFDLINKIIRICISPGFTDEVSSFVRSTFQFSDISLDFKDYFYSKERETEEEIYTKLKPFLELSPNILFYGKSEFAALTSRFLNDFRSHSSVIIDVEDWNGGNDILMQWIKGEMPNLQYLSIRYCNIMKKEDFFTQEIEEFVKDKSVSGDDFSGKIVVPGLPVLSFRTRSYTKSYNFIVEKRIDVIFERQE